MVEFLERLPLEPEFLAVGFAGLVALWCGMIVAGKLRRRRRLRNLPPPPDLAIDVSALPQEGPPTRGPRLELYNIPVRLAVFVLAPTGRGSQLPDDDRLPELVDQIVPGFMRVLETHRPLYRRWPAQLSSEGFSNIFSASVRLPGKGRGTPWSSLAGRCEWEGQNFQVGLVLCAATANSLSQINVQRQTQWLDMLRVRG